MARKVVIADRPRIAVWSVQDVAVHSAPDRLDLGLIVAAGSALLAPALSLAAGESPAWLPGSNGLWRASHLSAFEGFDLGPFSGALATQTLIFVAVILLWRAIARYGPQSGWLLPELRADAQARDLFDPTRQNVLIYIARAQRTARIVVSPALKGSIAPDTVEQARQAIIESMKRGDEDVAIRRARALLEAVL